VNIVNLAQQVLIVVSFFAGSVLGGLVYKLPRLMPEIRAILRSILFQVTMLLLVLYATSSGESVFVSSFLLFALGNSFYLQWRDHQKGVLLEWFDVLKEPPSDNLLVGYFALSGFIFLYSVINFVF